MLLREGRDFKEYDNADIYWMVINMHAGWIPYQLYIVEFIERVYRKRANTCDNYNNLAVI